MIFSYVDHREKEKKIVSNIKHYVDSDDFLFRLLTRSLLSTFGTRLHFYCFLYLFFFNFIFGVVHNVTHSLSFCHIVVLSSSHQFNWFQRGLKTVKKKTKHPCKNTIPYVVYISRISCEQIWF